VRQIPCLLFILIAAAGITAAQQRKIIVAQDGSGDYSTVQAAFDAVPADSKTATTIFVKKGVYREKLVLDSSKKNLTLLGEDPFNTILTYDDHTGKISLRGDTINTRTSYSLLVKAEDFSAMNISFQNDAGFAAGQAVALESDGDRAFFSNCRFIGFQDVLFTNNEQSRQYYRDCYIEGTTDFIFGTATAWFEHCHIHSKKNSHVTAAATPQAHPFGYIFYNCVLTGDTAVHSASLGRPWRPFAAVAYIHCYIGGHIKPEGWSNWNDTGNYKTARYSEYKNYGPSAETERRVNWIKQLTDQEVLQYTVKQVLRGWDADSR
jgi:pectinesterase